MEKVINALGKIMSCLLFLLRKIMSCLLFLLEIITPCLLFLLPVINIIANNWRNNLESLLFLGNAVVLLLMLILLFLKSWKHKNKESLDFFITDDLKGFVHKSFTLLLTLSSIVYKDNSSEEKPKVINFFHTYYDIKYFELVSLVLMTGVVAASLIFYSSIKNKKESKGLNLFFAIDLFVFIDYFAALLAIKEINSFGFDDWILFSLVFLIVFIVIVFIVILIKNPKIKSIFLPVFSKIKSIFLPVFSKIKLKDHSESTATEEPNFEFFGILGTFFLDIYLYLLCMYKSESAATEEPKGQLELAATERVHSPVELKNQANYKK